MLKKVRRSLWLARKNWRPWPEGQEGLKVRDHRQMVGGRWDEIGPLQLDFLKSEGLSPDDVVLDIGCGSFRAGRLLIDYLKPGHYLGIDKQEELINQGCEKELGERLIAEKEPELVVSSDFDFRLFSKKPSVAIAQSVFTHLAARDIRRCLKNLGSFVEKGCVLYATFFEAEYEVWHLLPSQSSRRFEYTPSQLVKFGGAYGWNSEYIGDWGHPRNQKMMKYTR